MRLSRNIIYYLLRLNLIFIRLSISFSYVLNNFFFFVK